MTSLRSKIARAQHELPPELIDRVIDFLHNDPKTLVACSLVASSWTATSRYHRFSRVKLICPNDWTKLDRLVELSPTVVHYVRAVAMDLTNSAPPAKWTAAFTSFTSLEHLALSGAIIPPWESEAAAISSVVHKITTLDINVAFASGNDFWPIVRMFPNLVSLRSTGTRYVTMLSLLLSSLPRYSPPISSVSIMTAGQEHVLEHLCNPPYPLTSLSTLEICDTDPEQGPGLEALAEAHAGQISRLRLYVRTCSHRCRSLRLFRSWPSLLMTAVDSPDYISRFTNLRHLTFANLYLTPRDHYKRSGNGVSFAWVHGAIAALQAPITHLTIEVIVLQPADLNAVDWKSIDNLLFIREIFRSLVQVWVVFLDTLEDGDQNPKSIAHPEAIRRQMLLTSAMGLLTIATRGPELYP